LWIGKREKMAGIWAKYNAALTANPLKVKTLTSFFGFTLGDLIAQSPDMLSGKPWDYMRTARFSAFGLCIHGPIGHYWYQFLDRTVMTNAPKSGIAVATKTAIDQLLWAPIFTSIFFSFMKTVEGHPDQVVDEVKTKLWPTMKVNWGVWPLAHLINFRFVPSSQRILYINSVQIGYNTFLSTMAAAKTKEETPAA
jgi:protein Mpv17